MAEVTEETSPSPEPSNGPIVTALPDTNDNTDSSPSDTRTSNVASSGETSGAAPAKPTPPKPLPTERPPTAPAPSVSTDVESSSEAPLPPTYGPSLIVNGDFDDRGTLWSLDRPNLLTTVDYSSDRVCITGRMRTHVVLGWPSEPSDSLDLPAGRYRFSFRARGSGVRLWAKVGYAYEPYYTLFEAEWYGEESGWHDVVHEFTLDGSDAVGVAFSIDLDNNVVCLDDVELRAEVTGTELTADAGN